MPQALLKSGHRHPALVSTSGTKSKDKDTTKKRKRRKSKTKSKRTNRNWFHPKVQSGWSKDDAPTVRRQAVLKAHKGNLLSAARGKIALANVTQDSATEKAARADAKYFLDKYHKEKGE